MGDELLREMAQRIFSEGHSDFVARLRCDEFVILPEQETLSDYSDVAARYIKQAVLVRMIIALGKALGISVIVEGVETTEQLEFLKSAGCTQTQGFYHAKALPGFEFERLLKGFGRIML